uniref:DUF834 domain-containing protein n=1 Tax=Oryza glumipatula TaxID=40148 RepID=A0A0E0AUK6_9ORYZ
MEAATAGSMSPNLVEAGSGGRCSGGVGGVEEEATDAGGWGMEAAATRSMSPNLVEARSGNWRSGGVGGVGEEAADAGGWEMDVAAAGSTSSNLVEARSGGRLSRKRLWQPDLYPGGQIRGWPSVWRQGRRQRRPDPCLGGQRRLDPTTDGWEG